MKDYCLWIVNPPRYAHSSAFDEIALSLSRAFTEIGYTVPIIRDAASITPYPIILGCNLLRCYPHLTLPKESILFNLEQIEVNSPWLTQDYIDLLRLYTVWDYSKKNISLLRELNVINVKLCRIGYVPALTNIKQAHEDIDILFYGSLNERRLNILKALSKEGFTVKALFGTYGEERDNYIARSKIILNIHFYDSKVFEIVRIFYLLSNKKCVISETGTDKELEEPFKNGVVFAAYSDLVSTCAAYLNDDHLRKKTGETGFIQIKSLNQVEFLKQALKL